MKVNELIEQMIKLNSADLERLNEYIQKERNLRENEAEEECLKQYEV